MINKQICFYSLALIIGTIASNCLAITNQNFGVNQKTSVLAIPIDPSQPSPYTISAPGCYKLTDNMTDFQIIIASSDVALLLNGFTINNPTLPNHAIIINAGLSDIIIQGGSITGNNIPTFAGIFINDNCSNILVTALRISNEFNGVTCVPGTGSNNVLVKENNFANCDFGIFASNPQNIKIKQDVICSPAYAPASGTTAIYIEFAEGTVIEGCSISSVNTGIELNSSSGSKIRDNTLVFLSENQPDQAIIYLYLGTSNIVENCSISGVLTTTNGGLFGIVLENENMSVVNKCQVNDLHGSTNHATGIQIHRTIALDDYCIVQDSVASNIFGHDLTATTYGFELLDTTLSTTHANFLNNIAINCIDLLGGTGKAYSNNIINVVSTPQADEYIWNWSFTESPC